MPSLLPSITGLLVQGDTLTKLADYASGDMAVTVRAVQIATPEILNGLAERADDDDGPVVVTELLDAADRLGLSDLPAFLDRGRNEVGNQMLARIYGTDRS